MFTNRNVGKTLVTRTQGTKVRHNLMFSCCILGVALHCLALLWFCCRR
jgi:hypothetical protein